MTNAVMALDAFQTGDRVKLKSGGPMMTVSEISADKIECSWFVEGALRRESFIPDMLKIFAPKKRQAGAVE